MIAKNIRNFIDNFLIEDKSKETLEVKNPKKCWCWYDRAMDELQELERLAKIGLDITTPKKTIQDEYKRIMCVNGHSLPVIVKKNKMPNCPFCGQKLDWKK